MPHASLKWMNEWMDAVSNLVRTVCSGRKRAQSERVLRPKKIGNDASG